jgi:hypothetical protein
MKRYLFVITIVLTMFILLVVGAGCKGSATTTTSAVKPGSGAVINSDSIVTATIQSITKQSTGYPWKMDVMIQSTTDVNNLPNPVKDSVGSVVTVFTNENMTSFKVGDVVTGQIKYVGDVNIPSGISLYMYTIALDVKTPAY